MVTAQQRPPWGSSEHLGKENCQGRMSFKTLSPGCPPGSGFSKCHSVSMHTLWLTVIIVVCFPSPYVTFSQCLLLESSMAKLSLSSKLTFEPMSFTQLYPPESGFGTNGGCFSVSPGLDC